MTLLLRWPRLLGGCSLPLAALARLGSFAPLPLLTSCLVDDPPAYRAPQRTPPRISTLRVLPRLDELITYPDNSTEMIAFEIPITSEDAGDAVEAHLYKNHIGVSASALLGKLPPSTLDEGERILRMQWKPEVTDPPGCYRIILRVSHAGNWRATSELYDPSDVDEAYWFAKVFLDAPGSSTVANRDCPDATSNPL